MNIQVAQVQTGAPGQGVPGLFPDGGPAQAKVIEFQPRIRAQRLFDVFQSLAGLRAGDTIEQVGVGSALVSIDLAGHTDKRTTAEIKGGALVVSAHGWGGETVLRRLDVAQGTRVVSTSRSGTALDIELSRFDHGPDPWPARARGLATAAA